MARVVWTSKREVLEGFLTEPGKTVILFTAPGWCGPCKQFAPHYERAAGDADEVSFLAVDVDKADWAMLDFGIRTVPTVKLYEHGTFVRDVKAPQGALPFISDIRS